MTKHSALYDVCTVFVITGMGFAAMMLSGCVSAEEQRHANLYEDAGTCTDFGARYGSRSHTDCMMRQQERRDNEQLLNMERARISSETARNNLEMLRLMRERRQH
ncbi:hypothetical protein GAO09_23780 [Rhizobiales bacterium RZME27]|uniref:Lipoprotein n=1 Tax=Endobacterium cereale TaxID=2663029 RepID=A0A6A8AE61_9HYPH|nr:hypothetical protein [Endobacterium cereale]MEB2847210.1 hypothetical protein [Endobacterium cereale]MQY49059.1 hypothetical protein [Endobacterium cereale]